MQAGRPGNTHIGMDRGATGQLSKLNPHAYPGPDQWQYIHIEPFHLNHAGVVVGEDGAEQAVDAVGTAADLGQYPRGFERDDGAFADSADPRVVTAEPRAVADETATAIRSTDCSAGAEPPTAQLSRCPRHTRSSRGPAPTWWRTPHRPARPRPRDDRRR